MSKSEVLGGASLSRRNASFIRVSVYMAQLLLDVLAIAASLMILSYLIDRTVLSPPDSLLLFVGVPVFVIASFYARSYSLKAVQSYHLAVSRLLHAWLVTLAVLLLLAFTGKASDHFSRSLFLVGAVLTPLPLIVNRLLLVHAIKTRGRRLFIRKLFIDDDAPAQVSDTFDTLCASTLSLRPDIHDPLSLHNFSWLVASYDQIVVSCPPERRKAWALYMQSVGCVGELLVPELDGLSLLDGGNKDRLPTVPVSSGPLDLPNRVLKRALDLAVAVPLILALSPLLAVIAIAVKLDSTGPILFRQQRMGKSNRLFNVYKFRSMKHEKTDHSGARSASRDDDRITRVGRIIRATSLDELPQLFNVLQGDMALVGPRPHALGSRAGSDLFWQVDQRYWLRHSIKPGITGLAQVRGFRGATDHRDDLTNRLHSDLEYVTDWSLFRDLSILIRTFTVVLHRNAY